MQTVEKRNVMMGHWGSDLTRVMAGAWCLVALLLALCALPAHAQYGASLQGTVTDSTGALVPGATLTLTDKETGRKLTTQSNSAGTFVFNALGPSNYTIEATRDGFKKKLIENVRFWPTRPMA